MVRTSRRRGSNRRSHFTGWVGLSWPLSPEDREHCRCVVFLVAVSAAFVLFVMFAPELRALWQAVMTFVDGR